MSAFPKIEKTLCLALFIFIASATPAQAKAIEFDTKEAHIVVVRPIDSYGLGDTTQENKILDLFADKSYIFNYYLDNNPKSDPIKATSDESIVPEIRLIAQQNGFDARSSFAKSPSVITQVFAPITLTPAQTRLYIDFQNNAWIDRVLSMGDPSTLEERVSDRNTSANWKMLGGTLLGGLIGGITGQALGGNTIGMAGALVGSSIGLSIATPSQTPWNPDAQKLVNKNPRLVTFNRIPVVDFSAYQSVDVFPIMNYTGSNSGEILIAYKGEKTIQAEHDALLIAFPAMLAFNQTLDQIKEARTLDKATRQKIWDQCVATGVEQCTKKVGE
jgi:hypothetical protein